MRDLLFPTIGNTNMADERTCEVGSTLAPLTIGSFNVYCNRSSKNTQMWHNSLYNVKQHGCYMNNKKFDSTRI
jgi:hypothetical protein